MLLSPFYLLYMHLTFILLYQAGDLAPIIVSYAAVVEEQDVGDTLALIILVGGSEADDLCCILHSFCLSTILYDRSRLLYASYFIRMSPPFVQSIHCNLRQHMSSSLLDCYDQLEQGPFSRVARASLMTFWNKPIHE